jgi:ribose transport system ATP-binding protein
MSCGVTEHLLSVSAIAKRFGATIALKNASFRLRRGQVHGLVGANGSGKSTLTKIVTGVLKPDTGEVQFDGRPLHHLGSPAHARKLGISAVYQELSVVDSLTVEENILLGVEPCNRFGGLKAAEIRSRCRTLLSLFDGVVSSGFRPQTRTGDLPPDERQLLELLKAISSRPKVLVLDETTASLGTKQVDRLFGLIKQWKQEGVGIVFVSHRMHELFEIADDMTVLRNGTVALEARTTDVKVEDLVTAMVGDNVRMAAIAATREHEVHPTSSKIVLDARIERSSKIKRVHLALKEGEILGLGGLQGQGQDEVLRCLFGAARFTGRIEVFGKERHFRHSADAVQAGIALVPGDRNRQGGIALHSIFENILLPSLDRFQIVGVLRLKRAAEQVSKILRQLRVKTSSFRETVSTLSGGNAQKVVIGKWLLRGPRILLLDDPTKGVDVMTKAEIYRLLTELRSEGLSIILYTSDDDEMAALCDRVLILLEGEVVRELRREEISKMTLTHSSLATLRD